MSLCDRCKNKCKFMLKNKTLDTCSLFEKQTNFDRITASPEALAKWVCEITDFCDRGCSRCPIQKQCLYDCDGAGNSDKEELLVWWLNKESKE